MAQRAILREIRGHVVRYALNIRSASIIRCVAAIARGRQRAGVIVCVTSSTSDRGVRPTQRKHSRIVIKRRVKPGCSRVALRTDLRESRVNVIWNSGHACCTGEILRMAAVACRRQRSCIVVRVAGSARNGRMRARQRKCCRVMVKRASEP